MERPILAALHPTSNQIFGHYVDVASPHSIQDIIGEIYEMMAINLERIVASRRLLGEWECDHQIESEQADAQQPDHNYTSSGSDFDLRIRREEEASFQMGN